jgi:hypothetical protein
MNMKLADLCSPPQADGQVAGFVRAIDFQLAAAVNALAP